MKTPTSCAPKKIVSKWIDIRTRLHQAQGSLKKPAADRIMRLAQRTGKHLNCFSIRMSGALDSSFQD